MENDGQHRGNGTGAPNSGQKTVRHPGGVIVARGLRRGRLNLSPDVDHR